MGVLGYSEFFNYNYYLDNNYNYFNFCVYCLYHGINWLYSFNIINFNLKVLFIEKFNSFFFNSDYFLFIYWYFLLFISSYQLLISYFIDLFYLNDTIKFFFVENWFKNILSYNDFFFLFNEFIFIKIQINKVYFLNFFSMLFLNIYSFLTTEIIFSPFLLFIQLLFFFFIIFFFIFYFFSFILINNTSEITIDMDSFLNFLLIESEKEITCFDDIILILISIAFIFGWYFFLNCWFIITNLPELSLVFFLFPIFYIIIIGIPTFLLYDFGIFYLVYLKGVGSSAIILFEFIFDYIAVIIFYTRILVQSVRLVLMIFIYFSMHELILNFFFKNDLFFNYDILTESNNLLLENNNFSYYFLFIIPGKFLYWIYEVFHMFFVVTVQFVAFFAIVFWLFLFLYTFFVIEKQENYFFEKRYNKKIINVKFFFI